MLAFIHPSVGMIEGWVIELCLQTLVLWVAC